MPALVQGQPQGRCICDSLKPGLPGCQTPHARRSHRTNIVHFPGVQVLLNASNKLNHFQVLYGFKVTANRRYCKNGCLRLQPGIPEHIASVFNAA